MAMPDMPLYMHHVPYMIHIYILHLPYVYISVHVHGLNIPTNYIYKMIKELQLLH